MAGRIPQSFINDLLAQIDIVEVIDARVTLKKAGKNYQALCPFHNEKTPSFTVSPDKQFYHCFGCGENGSALTFLIEHDRLEFVEAVENPPELPEKSPWLAGTLSAVLPGSGSFYVGRYAEGSLAFFATAVLIYGAVNAFEEDKEGLGAVLGALGLAFYGGSILAAANGAHKFNDRGRSAYLAGQRNRFGIVVDRAGLAGAFQRSF